MALQSDYQSTWIAINIAKHSPQRALTFVAELEDKCRALPMMPLIYPLLVGRETTGI
jgi:toxin ParE1/3/4